MAKSCGGQIYPAHLGPCFVWPFLTVATLSKPNGLRLVCNGRQVQPCAAERDAVSKFGRADGANGSGRFVQRAASRGAGVVVALAPGGPSQTLWCPGHTPRGALEPRLNRPRTGGDTVHDRQAKCSDVSHARSACTTHTRAHAGMRRTRTCVRMPRAAAAAKQRRNGGSGHKAAPGSSGGKPRPSSLFRNIWESTSPVPQRRRGFERQSLLDAAQEWQSQLETRHAKHIHMDRRCVAGGPPPPPPPPPARRALPAPSPPPGPAPFALRPPHLNLDLALSRTSIPAPVSPSLPPQRQPRPRIR